MEAAAPMNLLELLKQQKEWNHAVVFDQDGKVLAATTEPLAGETKAFLKLFNTREETMKSGIVYLNEQYDVHRFHPPLVYGRRGDPANGEGEGVAVCKAEKPSGGAVYGLCTYLFPTLSARAVPQLQEFCNKIANTQ